MVHKCMLWSAIILAMTLHAAAVTIEADAGQQEDAHVIIQSAISHCTAGGEVRIPAGVYRISKTLQFHSNMRLVGSDEGGTILISTASESGAMMDLSGCEDSEVCNLVLDGAENPNVDQGVTAHNARRLCLRGLVIRNLVRGNGFGPHGILFFGVNPTCEQGVTDSVIDGCRIENIGVEAAFGGGIRLSWGSSRNRVTRNSIQETGRGGIFADNGSTHQVIQGNTIGGSHGEGLGIEVWGGCNYSVIEDNRIDHWLSIGGCDDCAVRRNVISDKSGEYKFCGIEAIGSRLIVTDNVVDGGQKIGLSLSGPQPKQYVYWANNRVSGCNQWGSQIQGESGGAAYQYFYKCAFSDMPVGVGPVWYPGDEGNGFRFNGNSHNITMEECVFMNNGRLGIQFVGEALNYLDFRSCVFAGNKGAAASGLPSSAVAEWKGCVARENADNTLPSTRPWEGPPPGVTFTAPTQPKTGEAIPFQAGNGADDDGIGAVLWDFGEGVPSSEKMTAHLYNTPGTYAVTLIGWDRHGRAGRCFQTLEVHD